MIQETHISKWNLVYIISLSFLLFVAVFIGINDFNLRSLQKLLKLSARVSFLIFTLTFSASSLILFYKNRITKWILANRKYLGISFAVIHFFHLLLLITKNYFFESAFVESSLISLIGGTITYSFIGLMLLTSFPYFSKRMKTKNWNFLHQTGGYAILITFTLAYLRYTIENPYFSVFLFIAMIVWTLRILKWKRKSGLQKRI